MRDILPHLDRWRARELPIALATVIQTWGSAPRGAGAHMALTPSGEMAGSVSGGCVESAVIEAGSEVLRTGRPRLLHFGVADETAWEVGLACGGTIDVFVQSLDGDIFDALHAELTAERPAALATLIRGPDPLPGRALLLRDDGTAVGALRPDLDPEAISLARSALASGESRRVSLTPDLDLFVEALLPSPTLVIVGGVHIAVALASLAKTLSYRTVLVDPRSYFSSEARFPHVDRLVQQWPDEALGQIGLNRSTAVACLTHDPKLDDPALLVALPSPAFYVGALGSRGTQRRRRERLLAAGLTAPQLDRLRGPIGLNLNARTPEEIALSVMAEVVAARNQPP